LCLLRKAPAKSCELDPAPSWLLKQLAPYIAPIICHLCDLSLKTGVFFSTTQTRSCSATTEEINKSYRPISNIPYLSKLIERVVADRFREHLTTFNFPPAQQSAYRSFDSTETALLSVHNDLVRSVDSGKVSLNSCLAGFQCGIRHRGPSDTPNDSI